jgi:hypothetical protein
MPFDVLEIETILGYHHDIGADEFHPTNPDVIFNSGFETN